MSQVFLRGKGKPFPYNGTRTVADSPGVGNEMGCHRAACRVGTPYDRAGTDTPKVIPCRGRVRRGTPSSAFRREHPRFSQNVRRIRTRSPVGAGVLDGPAAHAPTSADLGRIRTRPIPSSGGGR